MPQRRTVREAAAARDLAQGEGLEALGVEQAACGGHEVVPRRQRDGFHVDSVYAGRVDSVNSATGVDSSARRGLFQHPDRRITQLRGGCPMSQPAKAVPAASARPPVQGEGPRARRARPQGDPPRRAGDAGPDGAARTARGHEAARRRAHHGLAAHDGADGGADRDAGRPRRRRALGVVQHLQHPGSRRRRGGGRPRRAPCSDPQGDAGLRLEGRDARGVLVVHQRGAGVARRRAAPT